ncbi:glycerophosphodiester phosphodiesterase [Rugosimonospora acidiphila]|uniref:Glycerophosphodiester phosphodiesterase n=1 Tax=Rugosimonospora acidiphila TaxID=556531 RepID=A0ABP9S1K8_9ACTN
MAETGPLVFAHRGSSEALPEHTLGAYLRAVDEGADGLECDVRLTRDGHLICMHDRRLERTSNGRGVVSAHTLAELNQLDFGSWHPPWPDSPDDLILDRRGGHAAVLTLERLLDAALAAGRPIRLLIETKHPARFGHLVEVRLVAMLRRYGLERPGESPVRVTVMSFSPGALRRVRQLAPELPTVLLMDLLPPWLRDGRLPSGIRIAGPGIRVIRNRPRLAERLRGQGNELYVWTVNTAADVDLVLTLGADGIISDRPRFVLDRLGR